MNNHTSKIIEVKTVEEFIKLYGEIPKVDISTAVLDFLRNGISDIDPER